jgi:hypothetical protein
MIKSTAQNAWDAQQHTPFNRHASEPMEKFRRRDEGSTYKDSEYDTQSGKWTETRKIKYNPTCTVPQEELDNCAHKFLIDEANNAQNELAFRPKEERTLADFENAQVKLRDWRGKYVFDHFTDQKKRKKIDDLRQFGDGLNLKIAYEVAFSVVRNDPDSPPRTLTRHIRHSCEDMGEIRPSDIVEIVTETNKLIKDDEIDSMQSELDKKKLDETVSKIKGVFDHGKNDMHGRNNTYFESLTANLDGVLDTRHFAIKSSNRHDAFELDGDKLIYKFNINRIVPGKSKIYHNPKVVQKMECDMINAPFPSMCVDLTLTYTTTVTVNGKSVDKRIDFVWTITKIHKDCHEATHLSYISTTDKGFFDQPSTLNEIIAMNTVKIAKPMCDFKQYHISTMNHNRHNYTELLNLHCFFTKSFTDNILIMNSIANNEENLRRENADRSCCFVYEYKSEYTVIASTLVRPYSEHYCTSYTIIHWNTAPYKLWTSEDAEPKPKPAQPPPVSFAERVEKERIKGDIETLKREMITLRFGVEDVVRTEEYGTLVKNSYVPDFFIPAMLKRTDDDKFEYLASELVGYIVEKPTIEQRLVLENRSRQTEGMMMRQFIGPYYAKLTGKERRSIKALLINDVGINNQEIRENMVYPGCFGYLLEHLYGLQSKHDDEDFLNVINAIDERAENWYEFLKYMPGIKFKEGKEEDFKRIKIEIENHNRLVHEINKLNIAHEGVHSRHTPPTHAHPTAPDSTDQNYPPMTAQPAKLPNTRAARDHAIFWAQHNKAAAQKRTQSQDGAAQSAVKDAKTKEGHGATYNSVPGSVSVIHGKPGERKRWQRDTTGDTKTPGKVKGGVLARFRVHTPAHTHLAAAAPEVTPTLRMQAEIDGLKRMLNELTLKAQL